MCGIYGWSFGEKAKASAGQRETLSSALALANASRGPHAWGVYTAQRQGEGWEAHAYRKVGSIADEKGIGVLGTMDVVMGHTRWRTTGENTEENAHPYIVGDVTLSHNGMIYNHAQIAAKYGRKCAVDSMHLAHHVAERLPFDELEGYGAIEYVRAGAPASVHLCRMSGGELSVYGLGPRASPWGVVWSSDGRHLRSAIQAARLEAFPYEKMKEGRVYIAEPDGVLYLCADSVVHRLSEGRRVTRWDTLVTSGGLARETKTSRSVADRLSSIDRGDGNVRPKPGQRVERDLLEDDEEGEAEVPDSVQSMMDADAATWMALNARVDSEP